MQKPDTVRSALAQARKRFAMAGILTAALDARLLLQEATGLDHAGMIADPDFLLSPAMSARFAGDVARRLAHEPVAKILGRREFYGRTFVVTADVLDPRPDTETLVDLALAFLPDNRHCRVLDLGVGSGAILLTLLAERPLAVGNGIDVSQPALDVARANAAALGLSERVGFAQGSWWGPVVDRYDLIISNPPYIPAADIAGLALDVRAHDPLLALDGGTDGLEPYRVIATAGARYLAAGGRIMVEFGAGQGEEVAGIFDRSGFDCVERRTDLAGHLRAMAFGVADQGPQK